MTLHREMSIKKLFGHCKFQLSAIKAFWTLEIFIQDLFFYSLYTHRFVWIYTKICLHVDKHSCMAVHFLAEQKFSIPNMHSMFNISTGKWSFILHLPLRWRLSADKLLNRHHIHGQRHKKCSFFVTHEFHAYAILRWKHRHSFCASVREFDTPRTIMLLNTLAQQFW